MIAPVLIRLSLAIVSMRNLRLASPNGLQANSCCRETAEAARAWWRDAEQCQSRRVVSAHQTNTLDPPRLDDTSHVLLVTSRDPLVVGQNIGFPLQTGIRSEMRTCLATETALRVQCHHALSWHNYAATLRLSMHVRRHSAEWLPRCMQPVGTDP